MFHRILAVLGVALVAAAASPAALAARIHVRVEGKTRTIFGANDPIASSPATPLEGLQLAARAGEFYVDVKLLSFGPYVDQIGYYPAAGSGGWVFKVNGASPPVGADKLQLRDGDVVLWYWADFDAAGNGPKTLRLAAAGTCYQVLAQDDQGKETPADGAALLVDGRTVPTTGGKGCPGPHRGWVKGVLAGAVRSNALR